VGKSSGSFDDAPRYELDLRTSTEPHEGLHKDIYRSSQSYPELPMLRVVERLAGNDLTFTPV
jgi:hypothetical protein